MDAPFDNTLRENSTPAPYSFVAEIAIALMGKSKKTDAHIATLEGRLAALEQRRLMAFRGAHDPGLSYASGDAVQRGGALFVALVGTSETPGSSSCWRELARAKP